MLGSLALVQVYQAEQSFWDIEHLGGLKKTQKSCGEELCSDKGLEND